MHAACHQWIGSQVNAFDLAGCNTLEVGSYNVNGTIRDWFCGPYVGVDIKPGPCVDQVAEAAALPFEDGSFEVVCSTEMLEHDPRPWLSLAEMARVLKPGGTLLLTARGFDERGCWEVHGYPFDFYRFGAGALRTLLADVGLSVVREEPDPEGPGWFLTACKL